MSLLGISVYEYAEHTNVSLNVVTSLFAVRGGGCQVQIN